LFFLTALSIARTIAPQKGIDEGDSRILQGHF